jgi:hypothetical protein
MDESTVRKQLEELRTELSRFDDERSVIVSLIRSYETWLRLRGKDDGVVATPPLPGLLPLDEPKVVVITESDNDAGPSFRGGVLRVIREAHGEPLHAKEILRRVEALGARTTAKNKLSVVALAIRSLSERQPIEKAGPRMWKWAGEG